MLLYLNFLSCLAIFISVNLEFETVLGLPSSCGFQWKKRLGNPVEHSDRNSWSWETDTVSVGYVGSLKLLEYHCASLHLASHLASHEQMVIHAGNPPQWKQSTLILLIRRPVNRWHVNMWTVNMKTCGLTVDGRYSRTFQCVCLIKWHYGALWGSVVGYSWWIRLPYCDEANGHK